MARVQLAVTDVAEYDLEPGAGGERGAASVDASGQPPEDVERARGQVVEDPHARSIGQEPIDKVGAEEAGTACDENDGHRDLLERHDPGPGTSKVLHGIARVDDQGGAVGDHRVVEG